MGIGAENGNHPCIWCTIPTEDFKNPSNYLRYSMLDSGRGARSLPEASEKMHSKVPCFFKQKIDHGNCNLGYTHEPLDMGFEYQDVVVDFLHLFLRISERLLEGFREFLRKLDNFTSDETIADEAKLKQRKFYYGLVMCLRATGINKIVQYYSGIKFKDLTGPEYLKLFETLEWKHFPEPTEGYKELSLKDVF